MNLGKRILGAVSAGALVLSMSAISAFAVAVPVTKITIGGGSAGFLTLDNNKVKKVPAGLALEYAVFDTVQSPPSNRAGAIALINGTSTKKTVTPTMGSPTVDGVVESTVSGWAFDDSTPSGEYAVLAFTLPNDSPFKLSALNGYHVNAGAIDSATPTFNFATSLERNKYTADVTIIGDSKMTSTAQLEAEATDDVVDIIYTETIASNVNNKFTFSSGDELKEGLEYTLTLTYDDNTTKDLGTVTIAKPTSGTNISMTYDFTPPSADPKDPKVLNKPTVGQSYAPISPVATVESGNPAERYISDQIRNNPNFATVVAGTNASNYFTDFNKAKAGAEYSPVYRVADSSLFASNITPEQYLNLVGGKLVLAGNDAISDNARYVVKVTFPREYINPLFTNDVIVTLVGATGAPNMNTEGLLQNNTVLSNGNKTVSADVDDLVARLNAGNLKTATLLTLNDKNDKPVASFTINASGIVSADNVKQAIDALSTYVTNSNNSVGNSAWNAFVKENPDAKSYPFQFTKDATFKNFTVAVTLNNIPSNVPSGDLYKAVGTKLTKMGSYTASGNKATFTLSGCSNYRLVYSNLDTTVLAAGEGANDSVTEISAESF